MNLLRSFPAAFCTAVLAASLGVSATAQAAEPTPEARAHFAAGVEHLDAGRNGAAYREFKAAYAISPKASVLGNIGKASERLERDGEAIDAYQGYLDGHPLSAREAEIVRRTLARLRDGVATVRLEAPGTFWIVDTRLEGTRRVVNEYGPFEDRAELRVRAGEHELKLDRANVVAPAWAARLFAGNVASHSFRVVEPISLPSEVFAADAAAAAPAQPEQDVSARSHLPSYVLWGIGAVGLTATAVLWFEADGIQDEADADFARRCPLGSASARGCEAISAGSRRAADWRTAALVAGVGAVGALVAGTVLFVLDSDNSSRHSEPAEAFVRPWVSPTGIGVSGAF